MKRFYKQASAAAAAGGGFQILLDGRPLRTPLKALLTVESESLAALLAQEWQAQGETINRDAMPLTRLATTVIDLMPDKRPEAEAEIADFAGTDLLCYRASEPECLVKRQDDLWQPWLNWAAAALDAPMTATQGIAAVEQPAGSLDAIHNHIRALDPWRLIAVHAVTKLTGSIILAFAMKEAVLPAKEARDAALLDEDYAIERWGAEEEQTKRHEKLKSELEAAEVFLRALDRDCG